MRLGTGLLLLTAVACSDKVVVVQAPADAGTPDVAAPPPLEEEPDAGANEAEDGPGAEGEECSFNHDCKLALRCECDGTCACAKGKRGTKKAGEPCADANECASAVCLEGPGDELLCSTDCKTAKECPSVLPLCSKVSLVGQICVREP